MLTRVVRGGAAGTAAGLLVAVATGQCPVPPATIFESGSLMSTTADRNDQFGTAVDVFGDTLVIGANQDDDLAGTQGAAHVFRFVGGVWVPEQILTPDLPNGLPPNCVPGAQFGCQTPMFGSSASLEGDRLAVGAPDWQAIDPEGGARSLVGRVFIFERTGNVWSLEHEFTPDGARFGDSFGGDLELDGDRLVIGAEYDDDACAAGGFPQFDPLIDPGCFQNCDAGAAYVYDFDGVSWNETAKLTASDGAPFNQFGRTVALEGDLALVGAPFQDDFNEATCLNRTNGGGAVYVYRNVGGTWTEEQKLTPPVSFPFVNFGNDLKIENGRLYIGAPGAEDVSGLSASGAVFVYENIGGVWTMVQQLFAPDLHGLDLFGETLDVEGDFMSVVALRANTADPSDQFCGSGAVYVFRRSGGAWGFEAKLSLSDAMCQDFLGAVGVAISDGHVVTSAATRDDPIVCCPCNLDGVVGVDVFDLLAFLDFWFRGIASQADFDGNFTVDVFDLLAFLQCWFPATAGDCGEPRRNCNSGEAFHWEGIGDADGDGVLDACGP